jgi:hypothetical protein
MLDACQIKPSFIFAACLVAILSVPAYAQSAFGLYVCAGICPNGKRVSGGADGGIRTSESECSMAVSAMFEADCGSGYPPSSGSSPLRIFAYGPFETNDIAAKFRDAFLTPMNNLFAQEPDTNLTLAYSRYPLECVGSSRRFDVGSVTAAVTAGLEYVTAGLQAQIPQASCSCGDFIKNMLLVKNTSRISLVTEM